MRTLTYDKDKQGGSKFMIQTLESDRTQFDKHKTPDNP